MTGNIKQLSWMMNGFSNYYCDVKFGTPIDFSPRLTGVSLDVRLQDMEVKGLTTRVPMEFIRILAAPKRLHRSIIAGSKIDDLKFSQKYSTPTVHDLLDLTIRLAQNTVL